MKKNKARKPSQTLRKTPVQSRSADTVAVIVEAAARVLEEQGIEGFNTNAIAERAGVSIGSLYQYFRNKDALLVSLFERQAEPFLHTLEHIPQESSFKEAMLRVIEASVQQQLDRPELGRILDFVERQAAFESSAKKTSGRALKVLLKLLRCPGAPNIQNSQRAALEIGSLIRAMTDTAGELGETDRAALCTRIFGAVEGYLNTIS
jgi:AcrR family transcriptional regulator